MSIPITNKIILVSDPHIGSATGLYPADKPFLEPDGQSILPSKGQQQLWDYVESMIDAISLEKKENPNLKIWTVFLGHLIEPWHHNRCSVMSNNASTIRTVATDVCSRFLEISEKAVGILESEKSSRRASNESELVYKEINRLYPGKLVCQSDTQCGWINYEAVFNGLRVHFTHSGRMGYTYATRLVPMYKRGQELLTQRVVNELPAINLHIAGQKHIAADTQNALDYMRLLSVPCLQFQNASWNRQKSDWHPDLGIWSVDIRQDGTYDVSKNGFFK